MLQHGIQSESFNFTEALQFCRCFGLIDHAGSSGVGADAQNSRKEKGKEACDGFKDTVCFGH